MRLPAPLYAFLGGPRLCARCGGEIGYGPTHVAAITVRTDGHDTEWFKVCEKCGLKARRWLAGNGRPHPS